MRLSRALDILLSFTLLLMASPLIFIFSLLVFVSDFHSPLYISKRIGLNNKPFLMIKLRSMVVNADQQGPETTKSTDRRITKIGLLVRRAKIDELMQLCNVLNGDMSLVGPRPNTPLEVAKYSEFEKQLLQVKPGITDFASVIFSNEGDILKDSLDPVSDYDIKIRPWKLKFGQLYINNMNTRIDLSICFITFISIIHRRSGLRLLRKLCSNITKDRELLDYLSSKIP